jgi:hypothetical protein
MHEEVRSRLNSVQNLLSSCEPFKNKHIKIYATVNLPVVVLHECETWSLTSGEECRLRVLKNTVVKKLLRPNREEVTDTDIH